jgi:CubicO group peptidase (beta-lactamase class C family)
MESDATWQLDSPGGTAFTGSGLSATLRDLGRFGLFALRKGEHQGRWLVPEDWFDQAGSSKVVAGKTVDYGYMWWPSSPAADPLLRGSYAAIGIFGQFVCVHPALDLVVVVLSARSKPTGVSGIPDGDFFTAVARAMA